MIWFNWFHLIFSAAVKYIESCNLPIDDNAFNKECGVGAPVGSNSFWIYDLPTLFLFRF